MPPGLVLIRVGCRGRKGGWQGKRGAGELGPHYVVTPLWSRRAIMSMAARGILVPGPKMALTPAS